MKYQELLNESHMLEGNINRLMVTKDLKELLAMYAFAKFRLDKIFQSRLLELYKD